MVGDCLATPTRSNRTAIDYSLGGSPVICTFANRHPRSQTLELQMPKRTPNSTAKCDRLADWFEKSGLARFTDTMEFRAKGSIEISFARRKELVGSFCAMDTIRIVNGNGSGALGLDMGYGRHEHQVHINTTFALFLPATAEVTVHVPFEHSNRSLSMEPAMLEAQMHVPAERIAAAFEHLSTDICTNHCINSLVNEIWHNSTEETGWLGELFCDSASIALVANLLNEELRFDQQIKRGGLAPHHMKMLIEFMSSSLGDKVSVSELAAITGLSEYHFIRAFRRQTGVTPYQYILRMRINRAAELLRQHSSQSIEEIAYLCGFCSASTLALHFKRVMGITPRSYRDRV